VSLLLRDALPGSTLVVAIDPRKAWSRVWVSTGKAGLVAQPCSLPTTRQGVEELDRLVRAHQGPGEPVLVGTRPAGCIRPG
jgi:hypothetical protein